MDSEETRIYTIVLIIAVTLGSIIAYFIISIIRQQRRNLELQKASILSELAAMEHERARIAADLHDDLGPILSVIKFQIDHVENIDGEEKEQLAQASLHLDSMISRMREIANNLMPSALHRKGLVTAVEEFVSKAGDAAKLLIRFTCSTNINPPEETSINIYRAVQEVVHNCIKHAHADELQIRFTEKSNVLTILCRDNGKGFDYNKMAKETKGIGLRSLKNRTEMMGGSLQVESKPGKGTAFLFEIPIS